MTYTEIFKLDPLDLARETAKIVEEEIGLGQDAVLATILYGRMAKGELTLEEVEEKHGEQVAKIVGGLLKIQEFYEKSVKIQTENFRNLLLTFAEDMRVVLIMIADRLNILRQVRDTDNVEARRKVAEEASYLYAPLAHRLGLYLIKSELEDLSLKYLEPVHYYAISEKLSSTKASRDAYIESFIAPVEAELKKTGLRFHIKGRTKSIHSIWQKMKRQQCAFEGIYDLFAIRIILDSPVEKEKMECWQAFSVVTNMYQSNPKRLRDWLSVPKSNGYESLHITVLGPENKWVEVQIRTTRMDQVAENGIAAHWRYKGVKSQNNLDSWLNDIRQALSAGDNMEVMDQLSLDFSEKEVYVFSPKGDLYKMAAGATVLDFAYHVHSNIGNHCVGARINNRIVPIRHVLHSGDTVEIITRNDQTPKQDWLNIVHTSRARAKMRIELHRIEKREQQVREELTERRSKKKTEEPTPAPVAPSRSAEEFTLEKQSAAKEHGGDDVLVIDRNVRGIDYTLAKCCNPIYGDPIFGFVTINEGIKIHRVDCPNAYEMRSRYGYRILPAAWSGKGQSQYATSIRVVGNDDIGIVSNITSIISKEEHTSIRSINIDSNDGLFSGVITLMVEDTAKVNQLIKKIRTVHGVRQVERL